MVGAIVIGLNPQFVGIKKCEINSRIFNSLFITALTRL